MSKTTPLTALHIELGAKMADFAGYNMPINYGSIKDEHHTVRNGVGVFDVSHMGEFMVRGAGALPLLQYVTTNNVAKLKIGQAQYSCLPNDRGGIVDDLLVYRLADEGEYPAFMLVVNAANIEKDFNWISSQNTFGAELENSSDQIGLLAVQGPKAINVLQSITDVDLQSLKYYTFTIGKIGGIEDVIISATGYTGSGGFELYTSNDHLLALWKAVFEAGANAGIKPIGLGARDTLRLEKGYCLYGNDISDTTSPIEAGLSWITKFKKGDFISKSVFEQQKQEGPARKLVGFTLDGRRVPRNGYRILDPIGEEIGVVTSGTLSPTLEHPIGLGYVKSLYAVPESIIHIEIGKKQYAARVVKLPFA